VGRCLHGLERAPIFQRQVNERTLGEMVEGQETAEEVHGIETKLDKLRAASWKVLNMRLLDKVIMADNLG